MTVHSLLTFPFKKMRSKAKTHTCTWISDTLAPCKKQWFTHATMLTYQHFQQLYWLLHAIQFDSCDFTDYTTVYPQQTFFFLVLRTWKGSICCFSVSQATASESMTQDVMESFITCINKCSRASWKKALGSVSRWNYLGHPSNDVGIFGGVVLWVSAVNSDLTTLQYMDL